MIKLIIIKRISKDVVIKTASFLYKNRKYTPYFIERDFIKKGGLMVYEIGNAT